MARSIITEDDERVRMGARTARDTSGQAFIPPPGLHVQTASTEEYPGGRVVHLTHGFVEVPPELANHSVVSRLVAQTSEEQKLREQYADIQAAQILATDKARFDYYASMTQLQDASLEEMYNMEVARGQRVDSAEGRADEGDAEPVDPEARRGIALTQDPMYGMVSAAGMAGKYSDPNAPPPNTGTDETPPTEAPVNRDVPHVTGGTSIGSTLNCTMGNWDGMSAEPHSYAYQWKRNGTEVGAPGSTGNYTVTADDAGQSLTCIVSATNSIGTTAAPPSNAVAIPGTRRATSA